MIIDGNGDLSEQFFKMQKDINPDHCIEVGAHAAEFSVNISKQFGIKATAFEAGSLVYEKYKNQANSNLVSYLNYAISDVDGTVTFKVTNNQMYGNSGIVQRVGFEHTEIEEVKSYRLDTYFKDAEFNNACLWIDVEGANKQVLSGSIKTLNKVSSIFIETEDQTYWENQWLTADVVNFLNSQGFILKASEKIYDAQQNLIFIKKKDS
jgi:FkbM family methyltransferase